MPHRQTYRRGGKGLNEPFYIKLIAYYLEKFIAQSKVGHWVNYKLVHAGVVPLQRSGDEISGAFFNY